MPRSSKQLPTKEVQAQAQLQLQAKPQAQAQLQPQAQVQAQKPLTETVKEGLAFGVGSSIGHRIITGLFTNLLNSKTTEYEQCMKDHDKPFCEQYNR
jgi:hypothetical protein